MTEPLDRRNFLKLVGIGAAVAVVAPMVLMTTSAVGPTTLVQAPKLGGLASHVKDSGMYQGITRISWQEIKWMDSYQDKLSSR